MWIDGWMDGWMGVGGVWVVSTAGLFGWMDGWMDGWVVCVWGGAMDVVSTTGGLMG